MNSKYREAFVWIWLEGKTTPVVAGKLTSEGSDLVFNYGKSYLQRQDKISIYDRELPLQPGSLPLLNGLTMPGCLRDGSPDAWGRRVLIHSKYGVQGKGIDQVQLDELTFLLESGSDRIGALDFQLSSAEYIPRSTTNVSLSELVTAAERVEKGMSLSPELSLALQHGSPIGGARPKALIEEGNKKYIAKFSSSSDVYSVIKAEFLAMHLASLAGLNVASVQLKKAAKRDVLLVERFDRLHTSHGWRRKSLVSALTLFELDEMMARYASYENLAEKIRFKFTDASATLRELFQRLTFNILVGNTDDHARNHAAFWDGQMLSLTPAYDICPQLRSGTEANQAMLISGNISKSQLQPCLEAAGNFQLSRSEALTLIQNQLKTIIQNWRDSCELAEISSVDRKLFASRQFLNSYAFESLSSDAQGLTDLAAAFREMNRE